MWTKPIAFVLNTDDHTKPGMHWVAVYVDSMNNGLYFDSYGMPPIISSHFNRIRKNCKQYRWNAVQLQSSMSDVCGQFCLMFLDYMTSGLGFQKFLENFSTDLKKNDDIARNYIPNRNDGSDFIGNGNCAVRCLQKCHAKGMLM